MRRRIESRDQPLMRPRRRSASPWRRPLSQRRAISTARARIVGLTRELRMPAIYQWPEIADEGGLMAYGPSLLGAFRQVTTLVAKILKGASPVSFLWNSRPGS